MLVRIADGLGIPRELMNLGPAEGAGAYPGGRPSTALTPEEVEELRRRVMLATSMAAVVGPPEVGEQVPEPELIPDPAPVPLPSRLLGVHVAQVREATRDLTKNSRAYGSNPKMSSETAAEASRLLAVPGPEPLRQALMRALAELHLQAGYAAFDAGLHDRTLHHLSQALQLATQTEDARLQTMAMGYAGVATVEHGRPNDGLALLQCAQLKADRIPVKEQRELIVPRGSRAVLQACTRADAGYALARMGDPVGAAREMAEAREIWQPTPTDPWGDLDEVAARLALEDGRLDAAESFAAASLRRWEAGHSQRARTVSGIVLATIHVRAGESDGLELAHGAITGVTRLRSGLVRRRLTPLATALEARPSGEHRELARTARHLATTRA